MAARFMSTRPNPHATKSMRSCHTLPSALRRDQLRPILNKNKRRSMKRREFITLFGGAAAIVVKLLALIALACSLATTARAESFAKRVDIGGGRVMYIQGHCSGSTPPLLLSGTGTAPSPLHPAASKGATGSPPTPQ